MIITKLVNTPKDFYHEIIKSISTSRSKISLVCYAFCYGDWSKSIGDELKKAVNRGVEVNVYFALTGSIVEDTNPIKNFRMYHDLKQSGINVKILYDLLSGAVHAKVCVIDGTLFVGGTNIADYFVRWTDTNFKITNLEGYEKLHKEIAKLDGFPLKTYLNFEINNDMDFYVQNPGSQLFSKNILKLIDSAKSKVRISTWYFLPTAEVIESLTAARRRNVAIKIIYPRHNKLDITNPIRYLSVKRLSKLGIDFYEWQPGYNHSKLYWNEKDFIIGSPNLNYFSEKAAYESFVVGSGREVIKDLDNRFNVFMQDSKAFS